MLSLKNKIMRLLFGASLVLGALFASETSRNTFLFCLKKTDNPLKILKNEAGFKVDNQKLNDALHSSGVIDLESWIPGASDKDRDGDIFLNRIYRAYLDSNQELESSMSFLKSSYDILYVEYENIHKPHYQPNDPNYSEQCSIESVKANSAWDFWDIANNYIPDGENVLLASVDTGVDYTHPDLKSSLWINQQEIPEWAFEAGIDLNGDEYVSSSEVEQFIINEGMDNNGDGILNLRDFVCEGSGFRDFIDGDNNGYTDDLLGWDASGYLGADDPDPYPRENASASGSWAHGTHVAGILSATTDNGLGMSSIAYNAKIISVKSSRDYQETEPSVNDGYAGITYAAKAGYYAGTFAIINNSWGGGGYSFSENAVINNAHQQYGAVVLSSAGNGDDPSGRYQKEYPAGYDNVLSVLAIGCSGYFGNWATYHESVDLAAPGESILSSIIGQGYDSWDGSSMACPNAASAIGLLKAYYPNWDNEQLIARIKDSADEYIYELNPDYINCLDNEGEEVEDGYCLGDGMVDVYKAIGMDFSPNFKINSFSTIITEGDGDSVINPGDSFDFFFTLDNEINWSTAYNIQINIDSDDSSISISNPNFTIPFLESGQSFTSDQGIQMSISEDASLNDIIIRVNILATGNNNYSYNKSLYINIPVTLYQSGFPSITTSQVLSSPTIIDINNDGHEEIIFGDFNGFVHILNLNGTPIESNIFPYDTGNQIWGSPAVADIDLDGVLDIVVTSKSKHLYVFDINGLKFSYDSNQYLIGTPVILDMDSDPELEIAFGGYSSSGDVFALNHDGTDVLNFPVQINEKMWKGFASYDLNGNGFEDIVVTTDGDDMILVVYDDGSSQVLHEANDKFKSSPSIINDNGQILIFAGSYDDSMYAVSPNGEVVFNVVTQDHVNSSASFVEIDGQAYAFFGSDDGMIYAVDMNGEPLSGWPVEIGEGDIDTSISFADLDSDDYPEIAVGISNKLYVLNHDGTYYDRFPIVHNFAVSSSPSIYDIDGDGDVEIVQGTSGEVVAVDVMEQGALSFFGKKYWNQDRGNNRKTGYYITSDMNCLNPNKGDLNCDSFRDVLDIVILANRIVNSYENSSFDLWVSDLNLDSQINISDIVMLVSEIIGD